MKFNIVDFNKENEYGELYFIEYLSKSDIIPKEYIQEEKKKEDVRNNYIYRLFSALCNLQECLFYVESYAFKNDFDFNVYWYLKDQLLRELGLFYDNELDKYIMLGENK